jgi:hypothetical protein
VRDVVISTFTVSLFFFTVGTAGFLKESAAKHCVTVRVFSTLLAHDCACCLFVCCGGGVVVAAAAAAPVITVGDRRAVIIIIKNKDKGHYYYNNNKNDHVE